jgi:hypothetical protein
MNTVYGLCAYRIKNVLFLVRTPSKNRSTFSYKNNVSKWKQSLYWIVAELSKPCKKPRSTAPVQRFNPYRKTSCARLKQPNMGYA